MCILVCLCFLCVVGYDRVSQDKILQSMGRGQEVTVTNDGATILKAIYVDNPAAKVLVGESHMVGGGVMMRESSSSSNSSSTLISAKHNGLQLQVSSPTEVAAAAAVVLSYHLSSISP